MGCDIHICAEQKTSDEWKSMDSWRWEDSNPDYEHWYPDKEIWEGRMYSLFGRLADVRGSGAPIEPKGMPNDASKPVLDYWRYGEKDSWHTPSWLTLAELKSLIREKEQEVYPCATCTVCKYKAFWDEYSDYDEEEATLVDAQIQNIIDGLIERFKSESPARWWEGDKINDWIENNGNNLRIVFWFDS